MLPLFESGIPLARKKLRSLPDADNITIAYPDEGSWKRFHYQFGDYPEVWLLPTPCVDGKRAEVPLKASKAIHFERFPIQTGDAHEQVVS